MSDVNARQVGGDHYRAKYQHWDWIEDCGLGYLEGCATKYVLRWRRKEGILGLEKAAHYVEKLREKFLHGDRVNNRKTASLIEHYTALFLLENPMTKEEARYMRAIAFWNNHQDLNKALDVLLIIKGTL